MAASDNPVHFALPKGRMYDNVTRLMADAGARVTVTSRDYRPALSIPGYEVKILKPRAIVEMLGEGTRDLGFAGADWVAELGVEVVELLDTRLDPVRIVAAAPESILTDGKLPNRKLTVASEYLGLARRWVESEGIDAKLLRSHGATEVLPPEDADCIVDNTATGSTLSANNLRIMGEVMASSTRLYASRAAVEDPEKRSRIDELVMLLKAVLEARTRVMVELNVAADRLASVIEVLPCMREPTVSPLHSSRGYAVKAAVPRKQLPSVIPLIKARGGTDIVVTSPEQIVP